MTPRSPDSDDGIDSKEGWFLYILECKDGTFYTGITTDLVRRFKQHHDGSASCYTRRRLPVKMVYREACSSRSHASIREWEIKSLSRKDKERLVAGGEGLEER